jgi:hypothetical protein
MNQPVNLNLVVEDHAPLPPPESKAPEPKVFVRSVSAPAGMPWSQARIAALEARLGAPLPLHEVLYQVHRLEPWRPGQPARYATFYVRAQDVGDELSTTMQVDGRAIAIQFLSAAEQSRRARRLLIIALIAGGFAAVIVGAVTTALAGRAAGEQRLAGLEQLALTRLKQTEAENRLKAQTRALDRARIEGRRMSDLFKDLNWASGAKAPGAHIQALHWAHGTMAVEVRGDTAPFTQSDRAVFRVEKPLRPGVWLWGVTPNPPLGSGQSPIQPSPDRSSAPLPSSNSGDLGRGP